MSNCPYCGAKPINDANSQWECGSYICFSPTQVPKCRIRVLEKRIAKLEEAAINYMMRTSHSDACPCISSNVFDDRCLCGHDELKAVVCKEPSDE